MIRVKTDFIQGKSRLPSEWEDGFVVTEDFAVLIDGAGTPSPILWDGKKGGRFLMELIRDHIWRIPKHLDKHAFVKEIETMIQEEYVKRGVMESLKNNPNDRPFASMVVYSEYHHEIWIYGDCQALVEGKQYTHPKFIDEVMLNARALFIESELLMGKSKEELMDTDTGRQFIEPLLLRQRLFQNNSIPSIFRYSVIDGFGFNPNDILVVDIPDSTTDIVLASDGYPILKDTLEETEKILHEQIQKDPLAIRELKGFNAINKELYSFDDRSYLKIGL